jgi:hypothetical protein
MAYMTLFVITVSATKILTTLKFKGLGHEIKLNFLWPKINISRCNRNLSCFWTFYDSLLMSNCICREVSRG